MVDWGSANDPFYITENLGWSLGLLIIMALCLIFSEWLFGKFPLVKGCFRLVFSF